MMRGILPEDLGLVGDTGEQREPAPRYAAGVRYPLHCTNAGRAWMELAQSQGFSVLPWLSITLENARGPTPTARPPRSLLAFLQVTLVNCSGSSRSYGAGGTFAASYMRVDRRARGRSAGGASGGLLVPRASKGRAAVSVRMCPGKGSPEGHCLNDAGDVFVCEQLQ